MTLSHSNIVQDSNCPDLISFLLFPHSFITEKVGLTGYIPGEIAGLPHLAYLNLSQNHIFGSIPNDFGMMKSLRK